MVLLLKALQLLLGQPELHHCLLPSPLLLHCFPSPTCLLTGLPCSMLTDSQKQSTCLCTGFILWMIEPNDNVKRFVYPVKWSYVPFDPDSACVTSNIRCLMQHSIEGTDHHGEADSTCRHSDQGKGLTIRDSRCEGSDRCTLLPATDSSRPLARSQCDATTLYIRFPPCSRLTDVVRLQFT